jgi:hypothetical protein
MALVGNIFTKESLKFTPFLNVGSAAKDPQLAFAFTMVWKNNINSTVRRIYSGHSDYFSTGLIFREKTEKKIFFANQKLGDSG